VKSQLAAVLAFGALVAGCRSVWVHGVIQTADEHPIANARVALQSETDSHAPADTSEPNGCFDLFKTIRRDQGGYVLIVDSPGYKLLKVPLRIHVENLLLITLEPEGSALPSTARAIRSEERPLRYGACEPLAAIPP